MDAQMLTLSAVHVAKVLQPRGGEIDRDTVRDYAAAARAGATFPPLLAFKVTDRKFPGPVLVAGFHRYEAYQDAGVNKAPVEVRTGTYAEAWLAGYQSNLTNGLRYTNAQKRAAVEQALMLFRSDSASGLAERLSVSHTFVSKVREELVRVGRIDAPKTVETKDGRGYPASRASATVADASKKPREITASAPTVRPSEEIPQTHLAPAEPDADSLAEQQALIAELDAVDSAIRSELQRHELAMTELKRNREAVITKMDALCE
jgi:hypothetical protein